MISSPQRRRESIVESDWKIRELERRVETGEARPARLLAARMRAGQLDPQRIELASALGHPVAKALRPDVEKVNWASWLARRNAIQAAVALVGHVAVVRWAADVAERVLPVWEADRPGDVRPREAIEAARAWADCPCADHARAADVAARAANAANVAANVAYSPAGYAARAATNAAAAAHGAHWGDPDDVYSPSAASAAAARTGPDYEWHRLRLAAYLLGEV